jgi:hypothetical protein
MGAQNTENKNWIPNSNIINFKWAHKTENKKWNSKFKRNYIQMGAQNIRNQNGIPNSNAINFKLSYKTFIFTHVV